VRGVDRDGASFKLLLLLTAQSTSDLVVIVTTLLNVVGELAVADVGHHPAASRRHAIGVVVAMMLRTETMGFHELDGIARLSVGSAPRWSRFRALRDNFWRGRALLKGATLLSKVRLLPRGCPELFADYGGER